MNITVIVLASGRSERFRASGGQGSKLDAQLGGRTVLERTVDAVKASGLAWHVERAGHAGMGDSIAAAVRGHAGASGWLILPGDLPLIQPGTLREVARLLARHTAVQPLYQGKRGHPVGFSAHFRDALLALQGPQGAAKLLGAAPDIARIEVDDVGTVTDIDTVEDLESARLMWMARNADA